MIYKLCFTALLFCIGLSASSQEEVTLLSGDVELSGTLINPNGNAKTVALIIAGSGPTDRDGNTMAVGYKNNSLKMVAVALAENGIASLRYDKRGIGKSANDSIKASEIRFSHFVEDAENWVNYLREQFDTVVVIGHSLGGLIGMMAAQKSNVSKFISLNGMGDSGYNTIKRQLGGQPAFVTDMALPILDSLNNGVKVDSVPPFLNSLFAPVLQDYLISWLQISPSEEIGKLDIPVLVVQGNTDIQVTLEDGEAISNSAANAEMVIVDQMNHVLKEVSEDKLKNLATYSNPDLPLHKDLMEPIINFIKK